MKPSNLRGEHEGEPWSGAEHDAEPPFVDCAPRSSDAFESRRVALANQEHGRRAGEIRPMPMPACGGGVPGANDT